MNKQNDVYFATLTDGTFLDELLNRITEYRNFYQSSGLSARWALSLGNYYGASPDGKMSWQVSNGGENGELVQQKVNEYASYVKHELVLAVKDRPAGIAKAVNVDPKTLRDSRIGSQLVEYYLSDPAHAFAEDYATAMFLGLATAEGYVVQNWDTTKGEDIAVDDVTGAPIKAGDLTQDVYGVWNVARDMGAPTSKVPWRIFSKRVNKFELASQFSPYAREIVMASDRTGLTAPFQGAATVHTDYIEEHLFIHMPTAAVPKGRYVRFTNDVKFMDVPFPYKSCNIHAVYDQKMFGSSFGHTSNYDLLGLEQVTDCLHSIILNNQSTFGVATIIAPKGIGLTHQDLAKGLRFFEVDPQFVDKVRSLDLVRTAPEIFNYEQRMSGMKGQLSGINSIIKGDPEGALKGASGSAMALLQSQALTYNSGIQASFYALLSSAGTGIIEICRQFADEPRIVQITGKTNRAAVREFKYDQNTLAAVSTIVFEPVNPILQTAAGKLTVAQDLLKIPGMITSPKRYLEVLTTGNIEALIGDDVALQDAILEENEYLSEGKPVKVIITENHENHIAGHQAVLAMPNAKEDPALVESVLAHIDEHARVWIQASAKNPAILLATGQKVLPPPPPPPGMGGTPGQPPGAGGAPGPGPAKVMNPAAGDPHQPNLPNPPKNPATGEPAPVAPGTSVRHAA